MPEIFVAKKFEETGYANMRDRNELIDIILTAYENPTYQPLIKDGKLIETFCNVAANEIAQKYGCHDLWDPEHKRARTADEIYDYLSSHSGPEGAWLEIECGLLHPDIHEVALADVQTYANSGSLVFAVQNAFNLQQEHGHICVIRPGTVKSSGKWGKAPACMNIGAENFIALAKRGPMKGQPVGLNEAFEAIPRFFAWKGV